MRRYKRARRRCCEGVKGGIGRLIRLMEETTFYLEE
jgi:hypothetical protein